MQQQDQQAVEEQTQTPQPSLKFTVNPSTGEVNFSGTPSPEIVQDVLHTVNYQLDQERRTARDLSLHELEIEQRTKQVNAQTWAFFGATILISAICLLLSINNQPRGNSDAREFVRGTCTYR